MNNDYVLQYAALERSHWWFKARKKFILKYLSLQLSNKDGLRILNIGAAGGASTEWLSKFGNVHSVENDPLFLEHLSKHNIEVANASVTSLPFNDHSFDLVCAFDVIEHVKSDEAAMLEMKRVCKTGGSICITVPAMKSLWSQHDEINGHYRRYSKAALKDVVLATGLNLKDCRYFNSILLLPVKIARMFLRRKRNDRSDFERFRLPRFMNTILQKIFEIEIRCLKIMKFPAGVSLICFAEKK